ncbi:HAD hydrolase-like protein [Streptomyces mirabilis]|uniref:HAD hydrolase-like protein n=1 Tax=Streptomyces mirabilis TaxID=68239 RepID=UPI0036C7072C
MTDRATPCEETARESTAAGELRDPGRVWMVGDNPVADIAGAHAVGVPGILIDPSEDGLQPAAQRILGRPPMSWP